jgi:phosphoesterase RecJ-like protein
VSSNGATSSRAQVLQELRSCDRFILCTHEHPDGDALGSLIGMQRVLEALGKDTVSYVDPGEFPLPYEYRFLELSGLVAKAPDDVQERCVIFLDCGNIDRNPADALKFEGAHILNIDHHHDNTRFGTVNHVVSDASCTAEIVWDLAHGLDVPLTKEIAEALYVGVVTDTGRFMYDTTGPAAHRMAAELIEAGVDVHAIYRCLYEGVPEGKLELLARGLNNLKRYDDGLLTVTNLTTEDYEAAGAEESWSEGVVDHLRALKGTAVAGLIRDRISEEGERKKVSLRATDDRVDVSAIAREVGGRLHHGDGAAGAHRVPARRRLRAAVTDGVLLVDKPAGVTSHDVVARERRKLPKGTRVGHSGTLDPFATGLLLVLVGRATRVQRWLMALPKTYVVTARFGFTSTTGDLDGEIAPGRTPAEPLVLPTGRMLQTPPQYSAVKVGGKRAYALARAGEEVEIAPREVEVFRFERLAEDTFEIECSSGTYVRSLVMDFGDAYCTALRRTRIGSFDVADAGRFVPLADAVDFLPCVHLSGADATAAGHGVAVPAEVDGPGPYRLVDDAGLIALAEPREGGVLKPIVGFRG